jgi:hypothetical protein
VERELSVSTTRRSTMPWKLRMRALSSSAFDTTMRSPVIERRRVVLSPTLSTVPTNVSKVIVSPTTNGLSRAIESDARRSPSTFCTASATATPAMPRPVTSAVMLTPNASSASRTTSTAMAMRAAMPSRLSVARLALSVSVRCRVVRASQNATAPYPQRAACT